MVCWRSLRLRNSLFLFTVITLFSIIVNVVWFNINYNGTQPNGHAARNYAENDSYKNKGAVTQTTLAMGQLGHLMAIEERYEDHTPEEHPNTGAVIQTTLAMGQLGHLMAIEERYEDHTSEEHQNAGNAMLSLADVPDPHVSGISCEDLFKRENADTVQKAKEYQHKHPRQLIEPELFIRSLNNCQEFLSERKYITKPVNEEEAEFPIAFSITLYKDPEQVERLLRAIYRPQNYYVIHVDNKSEAYVKEFMKALSSCFDNVFLTSKSINVKWGQWPVIEAELICMRDMWKYPWKYYINLTGQEFPLMTNLELVKVLKAFNGANCVGWTKGLIASRVKYHHEGYNRTNILKEPNPIGVEIRKGADHVVLRREFVDFVLHDERSHRFLDWLRDTIHQKETFFTTLNTNPQLGIPGTYTGNHPSNFQTNPWVGRLKIWRNHRKRCHGKYVRNICIFGVGDLYRIPNSKELFYNKVFYDYQPLVYDCLEERHFNKTRLDVLGKTEVDIEYYTSLDYVKHHI